MNPTRKKSIFLNGILLLVSFLITFLLLESGVRVYLKIKAEKLGIKHMEHFARSWPLLQGVEGKKYYYELIPSIEKNLEGFTYQVNELGLRDNKAKFFSDPEAYHILFIGASMTFGVGLNYKDTYGRILENKLNDHYRSEGRKFQVWNGGVPGYSFEQTVGAFDQKYAQLNPDMVIVSFLVDVFVRPSWHFKGGILYEPGKAYWFQKLFARSRLVSFILFRYRNQKYNPYHYYDEYYKRVDAKWNYAMEQVKLLNTLCERRGLRLLVVDLPALFWAGPLKTEEWIEYAYNLKLEEMCKKEDIAYTNSLLPFEGLEAMPLWAVPGYDCHFGPKVTQLVAENVFEALLTIDPTKE